MWPLVSLECVPTASPTLQMLSVALPQNLPLKDEGILKTYFVIFL
jgi:hypothetical protein